MRTETVWKRGVSPIAILVVAALACAMPGASARLVGNTIDTTLAMRGDGRSITVTGPLTCDRSQPVVLRVTVTQRTTGAVAQGSATVTCTAETQQWELTARARGAQSFAEGAATAVAVAYSSDGGTTDDAHQWLVAVTLVAE